MGINFLNSWSDVCLYDSFPDLTQLCGVVSRLSLLGRALCICQEQGTARLQGQDDARALTYIQFALSRLGTLAGHEEEYLLPLVDITLTAGAPFAKLNLSLRRAIITSLCSSYRSYAAAMKTSMFSAGLSSWQAVC